MIVLRAWNCATTRLLLIAVCRPGRPRGRQRTPRAGGGGEVLRGEIGRLKNILPNSNSDKCFLLIEHEGEGYIGCLFFEDAIFCSQIISIIKTHIGRTIKEIGDLDLSCTL